MNELIEFVYCYLDAVLFLFFFLMLTNQEIKKKKLFLYAVLFAVLQFYSDLYLSTGLLASLKDTLLTIAMLLLYSRKFTFLNIISALFIDCLYILCIVVHLSLLQLIHIQVSTTLHEVTIRVLVTLLIKVNTAILSFIMIKKLRNLDLILDQKIGLTIFGLISLLSIGGSYILSLSQLDDQIASFTIIMCVAALLLLYFFILYCELLKRYTEQETETMMITFTGERVALLEKEREESRMVQHDTKNQMLIIRSLIQENKAKEAVELLNGWLHIQQEASFTIYSTNTLINTVLHQKIAQFSDIQFHLHVVATSNLAIEDYDFISLLVNIIDNGCEELLRIHKTDIYLEILANEDEIRIEEYNVCDRNTGDLSKKSGKMHGYGLKIIRRIVEKYDGDIEIQKGKNFVCKIMILLEHDA